MDVTVVLPARNEAEGLRRTLPALQAALPAAEVIVVDDGSTDATADVAAAHGARVLANPYAMGNGAAIKRGARAANGEVIVFMDADGQHDPACIPQLLARLGEGYDMAVGARGRDGQANAGRGLANALYNRLASWMTGHQVADLTSGFRAVRADRFREFLHLLPNGFSYPTTSTMAFFLTGLGYYAWTFYHEHRFTNMSMLLFSASVIVFLIGLVSEQITALTYRRDA
jgi:glycosyltransferase involved in cell wall biosynthesis